MSNLEEMNESLIELAKFVALLAEDASSLSVDQAVSDYIVPILGGILSEVEANRQYTLQAADRANLAMLMNEKTLLGEILTNIADHFATILAELPSDIEEDSKLGIAVAEVQSLISTWMSFDMSEDEDEDDDEDEDEDDDDEDSESDESIDASPAENGLLSDKGTEDA